MDMRPRKASPSLKVKRKSSTLTPSFIPVRVKNSRNGSTSVTPSHAVNRAQRPGVPFAARIFSYFSSASWKRSRCCFPSRTRRTATMSGIQNAASSMKMRFQVQPGRSARRKGTAPSSA